MSDPVQPYIPQGNFPQASMNQGAQSGDLNQQQVPTISNTQPTSMNMPIQVPRMKEFGNASFEKTVIENIPGAQTVEQEPSPEISPELEGWMEKVERNVIKPPDQIVVADETATNPTGNYVSQPVIVLPATQQVVQQGMKQNVKQSVRWLAEWCLRMMKKFNGIVVYRDALEKK